MGIGGYAKTRVHGRTMQTHRNGFPAQVDKPRADGAGNGYRKVRSGTFGGFTWTHQPAEATRNNSKIRWLVRWLLRVDANQRGYSRL